MNPVRQVGIILIAKVSYAHCSRLQPTLALTSHTHALHAFLAWSPLGGWATSCGWDVLCQPFSISVLYWVDHAWAQKTCQDQNFHTCVVCATEPRVGGGRAFFWNISIWTANFQFSIIFLMMRAYSRQPRKKINQKAQGKKKLAGGGPYEPLPRHLVVKPP